MLKISTAVWEIISDHPLLYFGFHNRLLNLSQVARFIRPLVEARTKKEVRDTAVLMNLSRLQARLKDEPPASGSGLLLDKISIHPGLCSFTLFKSAAAHEELNRLFTRIHEDHGFITVTEGITEITAIIEESNFSRAQGLFTEAPRCVHRNIASVGVTFSEKMLEIPGVLYQLMQQLALQNINVIEVASTATEFNIYLKEEDVRLAFDSIYHRFSKERAAGIMGG